MAVPTAQADEDPVLAAFRTGRAVSPPAQEATRIDDEDPVMEAFRTGKALERSSAGKSADQKIPSWLDSTVSTIPSLGAAAHMSTQFGATARAGVRSLYDWATGKPLSQIDDQNRHDIAAGTYNPRPGSPAAGAIQAMDSPYNPLNWPAKIFDVMGQAVNNATDSRTWSRTVSPGGNPLLNDKAGILPGDTGVGSAPPSTALPTTGTGSTWLGPVLSGAGQVALGAAGLSGGASGGLAPPGMAATGEDLSLVPALRRSAASPPSGAPGMGPTVRPNLSIEPSLPRESPPGPPESASPDLSLAPSTERTMPSSPPPPGASVDLSFEPTPPRQMPGSASAASSAPQPPLTASGLPRGQLWEPVDIPSRPGTKIDSEPLPGGLPTDAQASRAAILKRVGLTQARDSALRGDAMSAATDAQMTKFDEPAGVAAKQQFDAEKAAVQQHAQGIIERAGGTLGTDEDSLNTRGQTIAAPFDSLRNWFDERRAKLYGTADERAGGAPVTKLEGVDELLKDPTFRNTLLARDQSGLLNSVERQLEEFRKQSPEGFTAQGAEQVRQWLNQLWTNDNRFAVGKLKDAIDNDVMKGAGEDIYGPARAFSRLKSQTLDNPDGIAQLFDKDPQTPLNRVTPFVKIPDVLARLDPEQFRNVFRTLQGMPSEIQPEAQAAIGEIKGHLVNKLLDAGTMKAPEAQWNAPNVSQAIKKNSAKLNIAFGNDPKAVQDIRDLQSAGNILRANPAYPGAAAQAANAVKRGMMTRALQTMSATAGAGIGTALTGGPWGAAAGAALGESVGGRAAQSVGESAALKRWQGKVTKLSDVMKAR